MNNEDNILIGTETKYYIMDVKDCTYLQDFDRDSTEFTCTKTYCLMFDDEHEAFFASKMLQRRFPTSRELKLYACEINSYEVNYQYEVV